MAKLIYSSSSIPRRIAGRLQSRLIPKLLEWKASIAFAQRHNGKPHELVAPLIISLTSYPARFRTLHLTLKCLLNQSVAPDRIILWIAHQDKFALTEAILNLQNAGLEIAYCDDLRSYKKIVPTLQKYPGSFIVTADDDVYYWPTWLEELVHTYKLNEENVICHRAHRVRIGTDKLPLPYLEWSMETQQSDASPLNFQTGVGGVLYPHNVFHKDVLNVEVFMRLCPQADDVWLYWMMRLNGNAARCVPKNHALHFWPETQKSALFHNNVAGGGNDEQITAMIKSYGFPL